MLRRLLLGRATASIAITLGFMAALSMPQAVSGVRSHLVRASVLDHSLGHGSGAPAFRPQTVVSSVPCQGSFQFNYASGSNGVSRHSTRALLS